MNSARIDSAPVYLDHAATTPLLSEVSAAMAPYQSELFGNPSSVHRLGVAADEALDAARRKLARAAGARAAEVVFTSGGTEANNLGVLGQARARAKDGRHVLYGPTEHASVRAACLALADEGFEVEALALDAQGELDLDDLAARLRPDTVLVAQMLVSNEFGTIYPVAQVARLVRSRSPRAAVHVDAVQALGKLELSRAELGADSVALSAHKVGGPKGAGALLIGAESALRPLVFGGGQEGARRSGTENVAGAVGLGRAAELAEAGRLEHAARLSALRAQFIAGLAALGCARPLEPGNAHSPAILSALFTGPPAEVWLHHLDARGVAAGAGSACQAKKAELSPGFVAIGLDADDARHVLRFSFGRDTSPRDVERALECLREVARELETVER